MDKVTGQCPQTTTFLKRKESRSGIEPRSFRLPAYRLTARPHRLTGESVAQKAKLSTSFFIFRIASNCNIIKILTLLVHAGLLWRFHNPPNSDSKVWKREKSKQTKTKIPSKDAIWPESVEYKVYVMPCPYLSNLATSKNPLTLAHV